MEKRKKKSRFGANVVKDVEKQKASMSKDYGYLNLPKDVKMFKESKRIKLDIIPYLVSDSDHPDLDPDTGNAEEGTPWYKRPIYIHRSVGADNVSVICPKETLGKKCPICEYRSEQLKGGMDWKEALDKPSRRNLYVVSPVGVKGYEDGEFYVWDISQYCFQDDLNDELEEDEDKGIFPDPDVELGLILNLRFKEESLGKNKFFEISRIDFEKREEGYDDEVWKDVPDLDKLFTVMEYKELDKLFKQIDDDDVEETDDKEPPFKDDEEKPRKRKTVKKKKPEEEPEPEEEKSTTRRRRKDKDDEKSDTCPFKHKFGEDWDAFADCDDCDDDHKATFKACEKANTEMES